MANNKRNSIMVSKRIPLGRLEKNDAQIGIVPGKKRQEDPFGVRKSYPLTSGRKYDKVCSIK